MERLHEQTAREARTGVEERPDRKRVLALDGILAEPTADDWLASDVRKRRPTGG